MKYSLLITAAAALTLSACNNTAEDTMPLFSRAQVAAALDKATNQGATK